MNRKNLVIIFTMLFIAIASSSAFAVPTFTFVNITNNSSVSGADFTVDVSDLGGSQVLFYFTNSSLVPASITDVYFDDGTLLGIATIDNSDPGVLFSQFATPAHLPGGNNISPPFVTTVGFSADSDSPVQPNGVNPGEFLGITFDLQAGGTFADIVSELSTGELRIGIRAQGLPGDESDGFIAPPPPPPPPIPAPGAIVLGGIGMGLVGWMRRRMVM